MLDGNSNGDEDQEEVDGDSNDNEDQEEVDGDSNMDEKQEEVEGVIAMWMSSRKRWMELKQCE